MTTPQLKFLSLFVPDLDDARARYEAILGVAGHTTDDVVPAKHPFASRGPVVFDLGGCKLALYQCDMRGTHPGDVGIGIDAAGDVVGMAKRADASGARVFHGPKRLADDDRTIAVFMVPDRHFFEVVGTPPSANDG